MIDLHTHTIFSDGELIPAELIRRSVVIGYEAIAITDHIDQSNIDMIIPKIIKAINSLKDFSPITVITGAEITHVPPALIPDLIKEARNLGAKIVIVHGETIVEPVEKGTNYAGVLGGADIIAHPGLISHSDLIFAKEMGVTLEISARKGHSLSNGYVAKQALELGIPIILNTDAHSPNDLITDDFARKLLLSSGIEDNKIESIFAYSKKLVSKILRRGK